MHILSSTGVVYRIPCGDHEKAYIGETTRTLGTHLKVHHGHTRRGEIEKSAVAEHAWAEQHRPAWNEISMIEKVRDERILNIKETFCIMVTDQQQSFNKDWGTAIADSCQPLLWQWRHRDVNATCHGGSLTLPGTHPLTRPLNDISVLNHLNLDL